MKRDGGQIQFRLRAGVGDWVDRSPWRIEWGGGSSVENPHFQRVHYCQLLVSKCLQFQTSGLPYPRHEWLPYVLRKRSQNPQA